MRLPSVSALLALGLVADAARATPRLVHVGDVDGDGASECLLLDGALTLRDGPALEATLWSLPLPPGELVPAMAGDLDGDGFSDLALGEPGDPTSAGRVTIFYGRSDPGPPRTQVLLGDTRGDRFGAALTALDLDGDGTSELLIGAPAKKSPGGSGWVGVYAGRRATPAGPGGVDDLPAEVLWGLAGLGAHLERAFDTDGDGRPEALLLDAAVSGPALVWRLSYDAGLTLEPLPVPPADHLALGDLDGDLRADLGAPSLDPSFDPNAHYQPVGDFDGDLLADLLATADGASTLLLGAREAPLRHAWSGPEAHPVGDVDGDGLADLATLDPLAVHHGRPTLLGPVALVARPDPDPTPAIAPTITLAGGPDLDLDGMPGDLAIGLPDMDSPDPWQPALQPDSGAVFFLSGAAQPPPSSPAEPAALALPTPTWNLSPGARAGAALSAGTFADVPRLLTGVPDDSEHTPGAGRLDVHPYRARRTSLSAYLDGTTPHGRLGASVALIGDLDGDGDGELAAAAPGVAPTTALPEAGRVVIYRTFVRDEVEPTPQWTLDGTRPGQALGVLGQAVDLDRDAHADLLIGAPATGELVLVQLRLGEAKLSRRVIPDPTPSSTPSRFGAAFAAGDLDGDGAPDVAVAAPGAGRVEVFFGGPLAPTRHATLTFPDHVGPILLAAADLDGDAVAELIVARPEAGDAHPAEGLVEVYGAALTPLQRLAGGRPGARLGLALAAFDRNRDHVADLALGLLDPQGAPLVQVRYGNDGAHALPLDLHVEPSPGARAEPWARVPARASATFSMGPGAPNPGPRRLEVELEPTRPGAAPTRTTTASGPSHLPLRAQLTGLVPATAYRARARLTWPASEAPLQPSSRWLRLHPALPPGVDLRTSDNHAPVTRPDRMRVSSGPTRIPLAHLFDNDYDLDGDALELDVLTPPERGTLARDGDALVFTPPDGRPAELTFRYRVRDTYGLVSPEAEVTLAVTDCRLMACRDGTFGGTFELPDGARAGFTCRVRYDVEPPRIECPLTERGTLALGSRACAP